MGSVAPNNGGPWMHTDSAGNVLDVRLGGYHFDPVTGPAWIVPPPMSVADYTMLYAAAWTGAAAFGTVITAGPWSAYYSQTLPGLPEREMLRKLVADTPPRAKVSPPIP